MSDRYCVFGHPVAHSWSPRIHAAFAAQTGEQLEYDRQDVAPGNFDRAVSGFFAAGGRGLNVTLPFKAEAALLAARPSSRVGACGAANTLWMQGGVLHAENTDGIGLVRDLGNQGVEPMGARILMLGAGGAVRGVLPALFDAGCASIHVANRSPAKARDMATHFAGFGQISGGGLEALQELGEFDLLINAISAGLHGEMPELPAQLLGANSFGYDMVYGAEATPFLQWLQRNAAAGHADGLGMLVEQAAESFRIWRQRVPDTQPVIAELRAALQRC